QIALRRDGDIAEARSRDRKGAGLSLLLKLAAEISGNVVDAVYRGAIRIRMRALRRGEDKHGRARQGKAPWREHSSRTHDDCPSCAGPGVRPRDVEISTAAPGPM